MKERRGWVTGGARSSDTGASRDSQVVTRERGKSTLPCVLDNTGFNAAWIRSPIAGLNSRSAFSGPGSRPGNRPKTCGRVTFPASLSRNAGRCAFSRTDLHVSPTSAERGEPSTPSRPGRLIAVTASQDRHETPRTQLGLPRRPGARPSARRSLSRAVREDRGGARGDRGHAPTEGQAPIRFASGCEAPKAAA